MGFFDTLIQSAGPPLAAGFAGGIEEDRLRRANLADKIQAYQSLMPLQMKTYEQQKQIDQRYGKPQIQVIPKGAVGAIGPGGQIIPFPQAPERPMVVGRSLVSPTGQKIYTEEKASPTELESLLTDYFKRQFEAGRSDQGSSPVTPNSSTLPLGAGTSLQNLLTQGSAAPPRTGNAPEINFVPSVSGTGKVSVRGVQNKPPVEQQAKGEFSRQYMAVEKDADRLGITDPDERDGYITGRMSRYRGAQSFASGEGSTLGRNTGPALASQGNAAYLRGLQTGLGHTAAELTPVSPSGQPTAGGVPAITQRKTQEIKGESIPAAERGRFAELYNLQDMISRVRGLTKNFQSGWFGPVRGGIVAPFSERITGNISPEEVQARRLMLDSADMLLRARSGAQINEQEYKRLSRLLPTPDLPENVAKARMDDFEKTLANVISERERMQSTPAGELGKGAQTRPTGPPPGPAPNGATHWSPTKGYLDAQGNPVRGR